MISSTGGNPDVNFLRYKFTNDKSIHSAQLRGNRKKTSAKLWETISDSTDVHTQKKNNNKEKQI